jgi:hypothetical protein
MAKERLSKLQKIILSVLKVKDEVDWENYYSKYRPKEKPPYWHKLRDTYAEPGDIGYPGAKIEHGVKAIVQNALKKSLGIKSILEKDYKSNPKKDYFYKSPKREGKNRWGYDITGSTSFDVSFSRSIKNLLKKDLIRIHRKGQEWSRVNRKNISHVKLNLNVSICIPEINNKKQ